MTEPEDIDALAAEYVLGTLDAGERAAVAARRGHEAELARAIEAWEARLGPLAIAVPSVAPPPDLFGRIEARINPTAQAATAGRQVTAPAAARWWAQLAFWRGFAALASLAAVSLAVLLAKEAAKIGVVRVRVARRHFAGGDAHHSR